MAFDNTNFLETAAQANNGDFIFTNRAGTVDSGVQNAGSNGDWCEQSGGTASNGTGPGSNPPGRIGFIYTETSSPAASSTWAMRRSVSFDSTTQDVFLDLIYNLNAELTAQVFIEYATVSNPNETTDWTILETINSTFTDLWVSDTFDFSGISTTTLWIRVRVSSDNNFTNDIAFSTWREYSTDTGGGGGGGGAPTSGGTVHIGEWRGGTISNAPTTTFSAAPVLDSQIRNDDNVYSFNFGTSTLTLPSSGLSNGYLLIGAFEYEDNGNARATLNGKIIQTSGSGNILSAVTGGYCRDTSENRIYVRTWAFVDSPSAGSTFQFQWRSDDDLATGGTLRAMFEVISFYYDGVSLFQSTTPSLYGGTTPNQIQNLSTVIESAGATRAGNSVTLNNANKNYLVLGSGYVFGAGNSRTQRWIGLRQNSTKLDHMKGYFYLRNNNNDENGAMFTGIIPNGAGTTDIDLFSYTGDGVGAGQGGANINGSTPSAAEYYLAVIELNNVTSCVQATNGTVTTNINQPDFTDIPSFDTVLVNSGSYFTNVGANAGVTIEAAQDSTWLVGANISCAADQVAQTARFTGHSQFFRDTTLQNETFHGNYLRNNQGSQDTFGWSSNQLNTIQMTSGQTVKNTSRRLVGSEGGGDPTTQSGWVGTWALSIDSMVETPPSTNRRIISIT